MPYWDAKETGTNVLREPACTVEIVTPQALLLALGTEQSTVWNASLESTTRQSKTQTKSKSTLPTSTKSIIADQNQALLKKRKLKRYFLKRRRPLRSSQLQPNLHLSHHSEIKTNQTSQLSKPHCHLNKFLKRRRRSLSNPRTLIFQLDKIM